jgi:uncharacterized protein YyaL (SSP411 family)
MVSMLFHRRTITTALALMLLYPQILSGQETPAAHPPYRQWGAETLAAIHKELWLPDQSLYSEQTDPNSGQPSHPAFMWGVGVQLSALSAATAIEPKTYLAPTRQYADAIQTYWLKHNGLEGFDVQPGPKASDRYYDDNAWLVLALAEVFELTRDRKYLDRSIATFRFVMTGEDQAMGGGLYWRETPRETKNTCTNAPAIVSALRLHQLTGDDGFLEIAKRLNVWTSGNLQDADGLFWDNIHPKGRIDRRKFSYNSALMIRANCLFFKITGRKEHLDEARRVAMAAENRWIRDSGAVADSGRFAHLLLESFLELHHADKDPHWHAVVRKCLAHLHEHMRDESGRHSHHWEHRRPRPVRQAVLLDQASPARIYWLAAKDLKR